MIVIRDQIGIFGKMNAGKSSLMNLLTQQATSIVDATPGTTADAKAALQEIHGLGPVKLVDTAGIDERTGLGGKKRQQAMTVLKECDLVLLVVNPATVGFEPEQVILEAARELDKQLLVVYNLFDPSHAAHTAAVEHALPLLRFHRKITLAAVDAGCRQELLHFVRANFVSKTVRTDLLPFARRDAFFLLNIPMDDETPPERLLRPQAMAEAELTRRWAWPVCYRMDLAKARADDPDERRRFETIVARLGDNLQGIITDSQAMDIMNRWTPATIPLTTFSIMMINFVSQGRLADFVRGAAVLDSLQPGDRILVAEACNHSRIAEDIGTVQIPALIRRRWPGVMIDHNFGREFQANGTLNRYRLVIHCGGCMISPQKLLARIRDLDVIGVPYTNYGIVLAYAQGREALGKVLAPWGIPLPTSPRKTG